MQPLPLRAAVDVLSVLSTPDFHGVGLHVSCYEIYGGKLFDLLNARNKLEVREDGKRRVQVSRSQGQRFCDVQGAEVQARATRVGQVMGDLLHRSCDGISTLDHCQCQGTHVGHAWAPGI